MRGKVHPEGAGLMGFQSRRQFLRSGTVAIAIATSATAAAQGRGRAFLDRNQEEDPSVFVFSRLQFRTINATQDRWDCGIDKEEDLLDFIRINTNIKLSRRSFYERSISIEDLRQAYFHPDKAAIAFSRPFLFMTGSGLFEFNEPEAETLREFLKRGGFWYVDDCIAKDNPNAFYRCFLKQFARVFPDQPLAPVPPDHEIYHCAYDIPEGKAPWIQGQRLPDMGLFLDDRLAVFLTSVDLHCGWRWEHTNRSTHADKTLCRKMGTNIVVYALTH